MRTTLTIDPDNAERLRLEGGNDPRLGDWKPSGAWAWQRRGMVADSVHVNAHYSFARTTRCHACRASEDLGSALEGRIPAEPRGIRLRCGHTGTRADGADGRAVCAAGARLERACADRAGSTKIAQPFMAGYGVTNPKQVPPGTKEIRIRHLRLASASTFRSSLPGLSWFVWPSYPAINGWAIFGWAIFDVISN